MSENGVRVAGRARGRGVHSGAVRRLPSDLGSPMKQRPKAYPALAVLLLAGFAAAWIAQRHRVDPADRRGAADGPPELAAANEPVLRRVAVKQEAAAALLRGEIGLADAAARF